jgi:hypothetical protein
MPEVASSQRRGKRVVFGVGAVVVVAAAAVAGVLLLGKAEPVVEPPAAVEPVEITLLVTPKDAAVSVDGAIATGDPRVIRVEPSRTLHNISAKAEGFEPLEKDVSFDVSKTVELNMVEVVLPAADAGAKAEDDTPDIEEIKEPTAKEQVAAPAPEPPAVEEVQEPEPPPVVKPPAAKPPAGKKPPAAKPPAEKKPPVAKPPAEKKPATQPKKKGGFDTSNPYG